MLRHNSIKSQNWLHESALSGLTVLLSISLAETKNTNLLPSSIFCTTLISFAKNSAARSKCCSVKVRVFDNCLFGQTFNQTAQRPSQGRKKWRNCKVAYYYIYLDVLCKGPSINYVFSVGGGTVFWMGFYADIFWESRCSSEIKIWGHLSQIFVVFEVPAWPLVKEMSENS